MNFIEKLAGASRKNRSLLCVGLDTDPALLPEGVGVFEFNRAIIDATADLVCAYKPNIAFYEAMGSAGLEALKRTRDYIGGEIPVIVDAKRGDIGNTARAYARSLFEYFNFDATTASPYLGYDSLEPFIKYRDRGVFILCRTSNPGAVDFQSLSCKWEDGHRMLFEIVAERVNSWNTGGNLGLVVGATYPEELKLMRQRYPDMPLLIPGVGAQGGELELVVRYGADAGRQRTVINSSRQILYASQGKDFAAAARKVALELRDEINKYIDSIPKLEANTVLIVEDDVQIIKFVTETLQQEGYKVIKAIDFENRREILRDDPTILLIAISIEEFRKGSLSITKELKEKEYPVVLVIASTINEVYNKLMASDIFIDYIPTNLFSYSLKELFTTILRKNR